MALTVALLGCSTPTPAHVPAPPPAADNAPREVLEYVPAAGLRWLCITRPQRIFADSALRTLVLGVLDEKRLEAFELLTAVDLRELPAAAIAGFDLGTLYVAELAAPDGGKARARFQERLGSGAIVKHPRPTLYRVAGTWAGTPRSLVSVSDRLLAVATGDMTLARVAEAYAERRLKSPSALRGAALSTLPAVPSTAIAVFYFPGPFADEWARAGHGLLASALAASVVLEPAPPAALRLTITLVGDWPSAGTGAELDAVWTELRQSSTGLLFGLDAAKNIKSVADLHQLTWSADLPGPALSAGLRAATIANVPEMFGDHPGDPTDQSAKPPLPTPD